MAEPDDAGEKKPRGDDILEFAIQYVQDGSYPPKLTKDRKRAVRKRATLLTVEKGQIFVKHGGSKVKVIAPSEEWRRILKACHSEPTSGHLSE